MKPSNAHWSALTLYLLAFPAAWSAPMIWKENGPGLSMTRFTNAGPEIYSVVRVNRELLNRDLFLTTTLASNRVVGTSPLTNHIAALPKQWGRPVAAMNADFFMMSGAAKGDPRGLHIWRGELVSVATGPAAFWQDSTGELHGEEVQSRLTLSWPGGGTHLAGLNEQLRTNSMVLFTPRMGRLNQDRSTTNLSRPTTTRTPTNTSTRQPSIPRLDIPAGGPIRPAGGREYILEKSGTGPWLPLRVGTTCEARVVGRLDGFMTVPPGKMLLMMGSNLVATLPTLTNGTPVTIAVATEPNLAGIEHALGTGPMLVREGAIQQVHARLSEQLHPRAALGWNEKHLYLATVDGRQKGISIGITLARMAEFMKELGCAEAINMDGGQSTTLMFHGNVINQPTKGRHEIANGIVILRRPAEAVEEDD